MCLLLCLISYTLRPNYEDSAQVFYQARPYSLEPVPNLPGFFATWLNLIREAYAPHASAYARN